MTTDLMELTIKPISLCLMLSLATVISMASPQQYLSKSKSTLLLVTLPPNNQYFILKISTQSFQIQKAFLLPNGLQASNPVPTHGGCFGTLYSLNPPYKSGIYQYHFGSGAITTLQSFGTFSKSQIENVGIGAEAPLIYGATNSDLYGTCMGGGKYGGGTVFRFNLKSHRMYNLHNFVGKGRVGLNSFGAYPSSSSLVLNNGMLYGVTTSGGRNGTGVIYEVSTSGSNFHIIHSFSKVESLPGRVMIINHKLYGTVVEKNDSTRIFSMQLSGKKYEDLIYLKGYGLLSQVLDQVTTHSIFIVVQGIHQRCILSYKPSTYQLTFPHRFNSPRILGRVDLLKDGTILGSFSKPPFNFGEVYMIKNGKYSLLSRYAISHGQILCSKI